MTIPLYCGKSHFTRAMRLSHARINEIYSNIYMLNGRPVRISFVCIETTLGSYADLTSKDGHRFILDNGHKYRHYVICRGPRIIFRSFDFVSSTVEVSVQRGVAHFELVRIPVNTSINADGKLTRLVSISITEYPEVKAVLENGKQFLFANTFEFLAHVAPKFNELLFLDALYVGQTETTDRYLRFHGHKTFTKIADQISKAEPQSELFIKLLAFCEPVFEFGDSEDEPPEDWARSVSNNVGVIPQDQKVSLVEAALISALQPKFNKHYKRGFPNAGHGKYNHVFNTCVDEVEVLVDEQFRSYRWKLPQGSGSILFIRAALR